MTSFKKSIKGDANQQNEQLSHNRIVVEGGPAAFLLVAFILVLVTSAIVFMAIAQTTLLETLIVVSFVGAFVGLWFVAIYFTKRQVSAAKTAIAVDGARRTQALVEQDVIYAADSYILYRDPDGSYQFRGTVHVEEHRQFLPKEISAPSSQEAILECWDHGMSGRSIEKWLSKDGKKVSYREISKTLDLYRPGWNTVHTVNSAEPAEE